MTVSPTAARSDQHRAKQQQQHWLGAGPGAVPAAEQAWPSARLSF